jgi:predicted Rossmann fold nucleotide-binding protein DprA/Smf involved in DNA uptake
MKVIIAGSRTFTDYELLCEKCKNILSATSEVEIVSGGAMGADKLGEKFAEENGYQIARFPANWNEFGKQAGMLRNQQMADYADALIVFWDGKSRGTLNMIELARKKNMPIRIINF